MKKYTSILAIIINRNLINGNTVDEDDNYHHNRIVDNKLITLIMIWLIAISEKSINIVIITIRKVIMSSVMIIS